MCGSGFVKMVVDIFLYFFRFWCRIKVVILLLGEIMIFLNNAMRVLSLFQEN